MKKLLSVLLVAVMLISCVPLAFAANVSAYPAIALNETKTVKLDRTNIEQSFKFVPTETAEYAFYSNAEYDGEKPWDTYGYIFDDEGNLLQECDDAYGLNFGIVHTLEAGKTYVLRARFYNMTEKGEFPVSIVKAGGAATAIVADREAVEVLVDSTIDYSFDFLPYTALEEEIELISSNTEIVAFDEYGAPYGKAAGKATLTIKSENGLTDTIDVTVKSPTPIVANTPVNATIENRENTDFYSFTPTQTGYYNFGVSSLFEGEISIYGSMGQIGYDYGVGTSFDIALEANETYTIWVSAYENNYEYSLRVTPASAATEIYIEGDRGGTQVIHYSQMLYANGADGVIMGDVEWSVDNEDVAVVVPTLETTHDAYLSFNKEGTVTVTAKYGDATATYTVTGIVPPVLKVDEVSTYELEGFGDVCFFFTAPESGNYLFEVNDTLAEIEYGNNLHVNDNYIGDSGIVYIDKNQTVEVIASRYQVAYYDNPDGFSADIEMTVSKVDAATGLVIDQGDEITVYAGSWTYLDILPENEGGAFVDELTCALSNEDGVNWWINDNMVEFNFAFEGEYVVTVSSGEFSDTITINVIPPETIGLNEEKVVTLEQGMVFKFTPEKSGYYTVCVESENGVALITNESYMDGNKPKLSAPFMADIGDIFAVVNADEDVQTVTVKVVETAFPKSVKPLLQNATLAIGEEYYTELVFTPSEFNEEIETAVSSDVSVVKSVAGERGIFVAVGEGTATIEITTKYGLKTYAQITVVGDDYEWANGIELDKYELSVAAGASETLKATVDAESEKSVTWISMNENIARVDANGRVTGISEGTAYIVAFVDGQEAVCEVIVTAPEIVDTSKVFTDVKAGKWYTNAINYAYSYGFIAGVKTNEFGRDTAVTRGMFITILARIAGVDTGKAANKVETKFTDVKSGKYYTAAIKWANDSGIVSGTGDTTFGPENKISRQDLCVMVVNFADYMGISLTATKDEIAFADAGKIRKYAKSAVKTCQMAEIVSGYNVNGGVEFRPTNTATRAEAAQILYKFHLDFIA